MIAQLHGVPHSAGLIEVHGRFQRELLQQITITVNPQSFTSRLCIQSLHGPACKFQRIVMVNRIAGGALHLQFQQLHKIAQAAQFLSAALAPSVTAIWK